MNLHDHMDHATSDVSTDLDRLGDAARNEGARQRRRRRGVAAIGATAAVATIAAGAMAIGSLHDGSNPSTDRAGRPAAQSGSPSTPVGNGTAPLTGRSTVAALESAVKDVAEGSFDKYAGQGDASKRGFSDTYGEVRFTPSDGSGFGYVGINVQGAQMIRDLGPFNCADSWMLDCSTRTLPNGDRLRTYRDQPDGDGDVRQVAELWTAGDKLRIVASANNGTDLGGNQWDIERPDAVLTRQQLVDVVTQDYWAFEIPERFDAEGQALSPYSDLDAVNDLSQPPGGQPLQPSAETTAPSADPTN